MRERGWRERVGKRESERERERERDFFWGERDIFRAKTWEGFFLRGTLPKVKGGRLEGGPGNTRIETLAVEKGRKKGGRETPV